MAAFSRAIACARCWIHPSKVHFVSTCRSYTHFAPSSETLCNPQAIEEIATGAAISRASTCALRRWIHPSNLSSISTNRSYTKFGPSSDHDQTRAVEEHSVSSAQTYEASGNENEDVNSSNASRGSLFSNASWETSQAATKDRFSSAQHVDADDVEARLLRTDDQNFDYREGMDASGNVFNMDHREYEGFHREGQPDRPGGEDHAEKGGYDAENGEVADDDYAYDSDDSDGSDEDMNVASDEEFEAEETDEELEELLANSPLMEPPEPGEEGEEEYSCRPDGHTFYPGTEYEPEDLDVTRPIEPKKRQPRAKLKFSVQEVIDKADFRNVRFLTKFIGETGNILARKQFKMKTKSHGRIIKAIKTARFFGLMPYTNMGKPRFEFNRPYDEDEDFFEYSDEDDEEGEYEGEQYGEGGGYAGYDGQVAGYGNGDGQQGEQGNGYHENGYNRGQRGGYMDQGGR